MYVPLAGFVTRLTDSIDEKARYFPVPSKDYDFVLYELLDDDHSFLEIRDGNAIEIVKVTNFCGRIMIERGVEKTQPLAFRCGVGVAFIQTMQGVKDTLCQMTEDDCQ